MSESEPLQIGPLTVPAGARAHGWLTIGEDWRREPDRVPLAVLHGATPGRVVYVQAVSDGDELNGLAVVQRLLDLLDPGELRGSLIAVPVANPGAFAAGEAADPRDGRKLNRCFPGNPEGSVSERLAWRLFNDLVLKAHLVIDLHQNGTTPMVEEVRVRTGRRGPCYAECLALARAFGLPFIFDQQGPPGQLARAAPSAGIAAIDPELGGNPGFCAGAIERGLRGVLNVLHAYGVLPGPGRGRSEVTFIAERLVPLIAPVGGVTHFEAELGDRVATDQPVARVTDIFGGQPVRIVSPGDGVLWIRSDQPQVAAGEIVGAVGLC